jgi:hypothetical protein
MLIGFMMAAALATAKSDQVVSLTVYGMGNESCAHWLSDSTFQRDGESWFMGLWSGLNIFNKVNHNVGSNTDGDGRLGEMKKFCEAHPSTKFMDAAEAVYNKMFREGK